MRRSAHSKAYKNDFVALFPLFLMDLKKKTTFEDGTPRMALNEGGV
jgi:hypothetical protein